jgi:proline iminopeptidase
MLTKRLDAKAPQHTRDEKSLDCRRPEICSLRRAVVVALPALLAACAHPMKFSLPPQGFVDAQGSVRLYYRVDGRSPSAVVVLHGGPGLTHDYLADDLLPLADAHRVIHYDQRGSGRSSLVTDADALDARRFADDLEAVRLHFGLERLALLGHSWGAAVAALYAMRHPQRVERLVLVGPMPLRKEALTASFARVRQSGDAEWQRTLRARGQALLANPGDADLCRAFYDTWFTPFFGNTAARARSRGDFCAGTPESRRSKAVGVDRYTVPSLGDFDWRGALREVTSPALIVHGTADIIPADSSREWAAALPNARLVLLEGIGHFPYLESPEQFFPLVSAFLAGD